MFVTSRGMKETLFLYPSVVLKPIYNRKRDFSHINPQHCSSEDVLEDNKFAKIFELLICG